MNTHEELTRKHAVRGSSDRSFGIVLSVFFAFVGVSPLWKHRPVWPWALALAGVFLTVALLGPGWLHPLNRMWINLGLLLGRVVNPVIMGVLFFLVVVPIALVFRLMGKDPLRLARAANASSYWIDRLPPGPSRETMTNQF